MRHLTSLLLIAVASLFLSGCAGVSGAPNASDPDKSTPSAAVISVSPPSVSFGSVAIGATVSQSVTVSNVGGSNLTVTQASTAANGFKVTGATLPLVIAAGKQSTFNLVFSPKASGAASGTVSVMSDASTAPANVSISGTGVTATTLLNANVSNLNFGTVSVGTSDALDVSLTNAGNSNVTISNVTIAGTKFTTSGVSGGLILTPGQNATLRVVMSPSAAGNLSGSVTVASSASNSPAIIGLSGTGDASVKHTVSLDWNASTSTVAGYNVYRSTVSGGSFSKVNSSVVNSLDYADSTVSGGQTYYYMVTSVNSSGVESVGSTQVSAVVPAS